MTIISYHNLTLKMQDDLNSLLKWSINNHIHFNVSKFLFIYFYPKFNMDYNIDGFNIPCSSVLKTLVLPFLMTYPGRNIMKLIMISKAYKSFGLLCQTFSETHCSQAKQRLYISMVRSTLLYCSFL